ncbi:alkyl hydroperoxide reductase/ Thiol specific antioxidant/ Mal allergen [Paludibacter propionicigenes WB4]|uniref:Alkyl hydroperoxide reductase/ Thiol specific antioxidant/ Mal allergen n=1 Tax=Paludibacter propionicigenes (strain DSM 17365 / JCM 13257 / WB4) TaxID=694427 RepID=E4T1B6_PALPW|nr:TlpA disulfide reductase family protein [Paludibacter propionicigenes]ADQ78510.1 alkyl hydroperoxide reductase/ Thiol specific antioxidant/ Mal allergen [Paludibacter propionicigenes WB4]
MKRIIISLLSVFLSFSAFAQGGKEFVIKGTLKNVADSTVILLMKEEGAFGLQASSDTVRNGKFMFKWKVENGKEKYSLFRGPNESEFPTMSLDIWVKPGSVIEVTGNNKWIYTWDVKSDIPEQIERSRFIKINKTDWDKYQYVDVEKNTIAKGNLETSRKKALTDSLNKLTKTIINRIVIKEIELLKQKPIKTIAGMEVLNRAVTEMKNKNNKSKLLELKQIYRQLTKQQKESVEGYSIYTLLYPPKTVKAGDMMVDGDLFDLDGNKHNLAEYRGRYILLDFWNSGCGACIMKFPDLAEIYEKQKDKLNIVGINMNTVAAWKIGNQFAKITWTNLNDRKESAGLATKYKLKATPHYVFISPEGKILFTTSYWEELVKNMAEYIKD